MVARFLLWIVVGFCVFCAFGYFVKDHKGDVEQAFRWILLVLVIALGALSMSGCSTIRPDGWGTEWKHDSGVFTGAPFGPRTQEDSLDVWNNYVYWQRGNWYVEAGIGCKVREGGFYLDGPPITFNGRVGKRFTFGER